MQTWSENVTVSSLPLLLPNLSIGFLRQVLSPQPRLAFNLILLPHTPEYLEHRCATMPHPIYFRVFFFMKITEFHGSDINSNPVLSARMELEIKTFILKINKVEI